MSNAFGPIVGDAAGPYALIGGTQRSIGTLFPDVTVQELHHDEMQITIHPVETGAPITDHAFRMPSTVEVRCGWSDSTAQAVGYVKTVYQEFITLQQSRKPFNVSTGKRQYQNMLVKSLAVKTDSESEYALTCIAILQEVLLTSTQTTNATAPNTNGSTPVTPTDLSTQNAVNSGYLTPDSNGNVSWANAPGNGTSAPLVQLDPSAGGAPAGTSTTTAWGGGVAPTAAPSSWESTAASLSDPSIVGGAGNSNVLKTLGWDQ